MRTNPLKLGAPVHIDCDTGIDDAVALMLALAAPQISLRGISSVSGNLVASICAANSQRILDLVSAPDIPVTAGSHKPLVRPYPRDPFSHGKDGLAELDLPASTRELDPRFSPDAIIDAANVAGGELTLICLGPLTNLALALIKDPGLPDKISSVVIIGGAFGFHNVGSTRATGDNPASEWNIYVDPEAAEIVFGAGFNIFAVGLDVATHPEVELSGAHRATLAASGKPSAKFLLGVTDFVERRGFKSYCGLIDAIAVACLLDPEILEFEDVAVAVETTSTLSRGQTVVDRRENFKWTDLPQIHAASRIDAERYLSLLVSSLA
jgi:purine nucleosidase/pyrimidine-specific ribonucleoside hydrolase